MNYLYRITKRAGIVLEKSDILDVEEITSGTYNYVYKINTPKGKFILKEAKEKLKSAVFSSVKLDPKKRLAADSKISILYRNSLGELGESVIPKLIYHDKCRPSILISFFNGHLLKEDLVKGNFDLEILRKVGEIIGKAHNANYHKFPEIDPIIENEQAREAELKTHYFDMASSIKNPIYSKRIIALAELHRAKKVCVIHGDLTARSIMVDEGKIHLIDFELAHIGSPEYDLGHFLPEYFMAHLGTKTKMPNLDIFFNAYFKEFVKLTDYEKQELKKIALEHAGVITLFRLRGMAKTDLIPEKERKLIFQKIKHSIDNSLLPKTSLGFDILTEEIEQILNR